MTLRTFFYATSTSPKWLEAAADEAAGKKRFNMAPAYSGGILTLPSNDFPYLTIVDLSQVDISDQARPVLMKHNKTDGGIIGYTDSLTTDGKTLTITGFVLPETDAGRSVIDKARQGYPWECSIGVDVDQAEIIPKGQSVTVNGQTFQGPVEIIRRGRVREVSFCVLGADRHTHVVVEASADGDKESEGRPVGRPRTLNASLAGSSIMSFEDWVKSLGLDVATLSETQVSELRKAYDAMQAGAGTEANAEGGNEETPPEKKPGAEAAAGGGRALEASAGDFVTQRRQSLAAELEREEAIARACNGNRTLEAQAHREGWTVDQVRLRVLEANAPTWASTRGNGDAGGWQNRAQILEAAVCRMGGLSDAVMERQFPERVLEASARADVRDITLGQLFGEFAHAHGEHVRPGRLGEDDLQRVVRANNRVVEAAGGFTSMSLPGILSNAANKLMLAAYQSVESIVDKITASENTNDYKEFKAYRLTGNGELQEVGPDGELKSVRLQEEEYANQVDIQGGIITLTEKMMKNDDLNAFAQINTVLGRMAADKLLLAVIKLKLANANNFYHANNSNLLTGAGSVLGLAGLDAAVKAFWDLKDANGVPILMSPAQLVVPPALKGLADRIRVSQQLNETTTANKASPATNNYAGMFDVLTCPYLGTAFNTRNGNAGSETRWWLEVKPAAGAAPIRVAWLNGQKTPRIEQAPAPFNVLGMQFRVIFNFGVAQGDKRTSVQNDGA